MRAPVPSAAWLLTAWLPWQVPETETPAAAPPAVEVRWLANAGFLLVAGESKVLIDGFLAEDAYGYGALAPADLEELVEARGVFDGIDVALASHHHADHFQADVARRFLAAEPGCSFPSSPLVIAALAPEPAVEIAGARRVYPAPTELDERTFVLDEGGDVRVEFLNLPHAAPPDPHEENLGHLITAGGVRLLHLGDAVMSPEVFAAYRLPERRIDVAFVPYWYFDDEQGRTIVAEHLRPARLVACHVAPPERDEVARRLAQAFPEVLVPRRSLEVLLRVDARRSEQAPR